MSANLVIRPVAVAPGSLLALHAAYPARYPALLESAATSSALGKYDILFAYPREHLTLDSQAHLHSNRGAVASNQFLAEFDAWWREFSCPKIESSLPFTGGWFVYLGYELAGQIEPKLCLRAPLGRPIAKALRVPAAVIVEHATQQVLIVAESDATDTVPAIERDLANVAMTSVATPATLLRGSVTEDPPQDYLSSVSRALELIARGDIYQANLSRAWRAQLQPGVQPHHLYRRLRKANPGPFCGLATLDDFAVVSSSPERLMSARDGWISTRPIAGTRPRGSDADADARLVRELRDHPKERAEHIMLIDLERNDLGRVCEAGSVTVDEYMTIETYAHVHHIVSNVKGRLRSDIAPGAALAAVFPGGTITGCPKVRCMEIIAQLEDTARGAYTGSLGYVNRDGSMDFNILIRSIELVGRNATLRAGAGVVADSIPDRELDESRAKARGVLRALSEDEV